jgi:hypothetical protein
MSISLCMDKHLGATSAQNIFTGCTFHISTGASTNR